MDDEYAKTFLEHFRTPLNDQEIKKLHDICGILRNRCPDFNDAEAMELLKTARHWDVSFDDLNNIAHGIERWSHFKTRIAEAIGIQETMFADQNADAD